MAKDNGSAARTASPSFQLARTEPKAKPMMVVLKKAGLKKAGPKKAGLKLAGQRLAPVALALTLAFAPQLQPGFVWAADYEPVPVTVETAKPTAVIGGTVVPFKQVTLAAQIPGVVEFVSGREGAEAKRGTVLVHVNDDDIRAQRKAAVAMFMAAQSALQNARAQYNREIYSPQVNQGMGGMGVPNMFDRMFTRPMENMMGQRNTGASRYADLQQRLQGVNQAASNMQAARAKIETLDTKIRDASLRAPFNGTIIKRFVEKGDTVQPGKPLVMLGQVDHLQIQAEVPVRLVSGLFVGMKVRTRLDSNQTMIDAIVRQIYPTADLKRHTVTVKFDLPGTMQSSSGGPARRIPGGPGMYAEVHLPDQRTQVGETLSVPQRAIVQRGSLPGIYVLRPDGSWGFRMVRIGAPLAKGQVQIISGLDGNEKVGVPKKNPAAQNGGSLHQNGKTSDVAKR